MRSRPAPILALLLLLSAAGCQSTYQDLMTAKDGYVKTVNSLADLKDAGYIDPAREQEIESVRVEARKALDTLIDKFIHDDSIRWTDAWATFRGAAIKLAQHEAAVQKAKAAGLKPRPASQSPPVTQPARRVP
jgi:hypothetical protein